MATFTLTAGDDSLVGTDGDDVFVWDLDPQATPAAIDGGAGHDTLRVGYVDLTGVALRAVEGLSFDHWGGAWSQLTADQVVAFTTISGERVNLWVGGPGGAVDLSMHDATISKLFLYAGNATGSVSLTGTSGDDILQGSTFSDTLVGGTGNDTFGFNDSSPSGPGEDGDDLVRAGAGNDVVRSGEGNDRLFGGAGRDEIIGGAGNDTLNGGWDYDFMVGGTGDDVYAVDLDSDIVTELVDGGTDTVRASVSWALGDNVENLTLAGKKGLFGDGNALDNELTGNRAKNVLSGKEGDDTLNGRMGADILWGGAGDDRFVFDTMLNGRNVDAIRDFGRGDDTIVLGAAVFTTLDAGLLDASALEIGNGIVRTVDARILYNAATGALSYDADGSGAGDAIQFALLKPNLTLTTDDFVVV